MPGVNQTQADAQFVSAKQYLMASEDGGTSLYDHLTDVMLKVLEEQPSNIADCFEMVSAEAKKDAFDAPSREPSKTAESDPAFNAKDIENVAALFKVRPTGM